MSESNVTAIHSQLTKQPEVCDGAVGALEDALDRARSGLTVGVYVVELGYDGQASFTYGGRAGGYALAGAMDAAAHDLRMVNAGEKHD